MRKISTWLVMMGSLLLISLTVSANNLGNLSFYKQALIRYHDSGQYANEITQVDQNAQAYLAQRIAQNNKAAVKQKLAVVFDIDETSLSNYPDMVVASFGGTMKYINGQMLKAQDPAIPQTLQLYNFAKANNIAVFFITGRDNQLLRQATVRNLKTAGYKNWNGLYLRPHSYHYASIIPFKSSVRKQITDQGYDVVFSIGDQNSDLDGGYDDSKFKLPNPFYYIL